MGLDAMRRLLRLTKPQVVDDFGSWSDDDTPDRVQSLPTTAGADPLQPQPIDAAKTGESIKLLQSQLSAANVRFARLQESMQRLVQDQLQEDSDNLSSTSSKNERRASKEQGKGAQSAKAADRDDDSHYFESYGYQGKVRSS